MSTERGVAPVPDSVIKWAHQTIGSSSRLGLTAIVDTFRRDRNIQNAGDKVSSKHSASKKKTTVVTETGRPCRFASLWKSYGEWIGAGGCATRPCVC